MKQTAVEWLVNELPEADYLNQQIIIKKAKEFEKEILFNCWKAAEQNMRSQFSSSHYKNVTFEDWLEKNK